MNSKTQSRICVLGLLVVVLSAVVAGCGGSGDEAASAAEPLSKSQFIRRADAACERSEKVKQAKLKEALGSGTATKRDLEAFIGGPTMSLYHRLIAELAQLKPPPKDDAQVRELIAAYRTALRKAEADPAALISSDPFRKANDAARKYGIEHCIL